jgi:hypothetical protein
MLKHLPSSGSKFFARERVGRPQWIAGGLLLLLLAQSAWLISRGTEPLEADPGELARVQEGIAQWKGKGIAGTPSGSVAGSAPRAPLWFVPSEDFDAQHSPLWYLIASLPVLAGAKGQALFGLEHWGWLARAPYVLLALLLGASLWYVARRLYGNEGGYIALSLYCFSPIVIRSSALWFVPPEMSAALGAFGSIFTAIAVSHTLYAPREVVLWNWRRIALLGLSLCLAVGSQFSLCLLIPLTLALMLYLAPMRSRAVFVIWAAACFLGFLLLYAAYGLHPGIFWQALGRAQFFSATWPAFAMWETYLQASRQFGGNGPALWLLLPGALVGFFAWPRCRYFGNTLPLLMVLLFVLFGLAAPHSSGLGFQLVAAPFLFVFVAGVSADLLDTDRLNTDERKLVRVCLWSLVVANALWNLVELGRVGRGV